jgi:hypothetical protein
VTHARIWKFRPPEGREQEFAEAYRGDGAWAQLFRIAPGYRGTRLLAPSETGGWWLTIDEKLEGVAGEEEFVGAFEEAD